MRRPCQLGTEGAHVVESGCQRDSDQSFDIPLTSERPVLIFTSNFDTCECEVVLSSRFDVET
jgi:hypothetical protein